MALIWVQNLATGIDWQDRQHRALFNSINALLDAMNASRGNEELNGLFKLLDKYIGEHFAEEEWEMETRCYPEKNYHRVEHARFIRNMVKLREECSVNASPGVAADAQRLLADWFYDHVVNVDKKLGEFLTQRI